MERSWLLKLHTTKERLKALIQEAIPINNTLNTESDSLVIQSAKILNTKLQRFTEKIQNELLEYFRMDSDAAPDDISEISTVQLEAEELICELKIKTTNLIPSLNKVENVSLSSKLPKLELPQFDGDVLNWHSFWDQFSCNIHHRNIPDVDKLLYLKSSLKGEAKKIVEGLDTTNKNYTIAIQSLKDRYGKSSQIIDAHYSSLYKVRKAEKTVIDCRRTLDEIERNLRILNSLGENTDHSHLRFIIMEKFPEDIIYEMRMKIKEESIQEMRNQLEIIISAREEANKMTREVNSDRANEFTVETLCATNRDKTIEHNSERDKRSKENFNKYTGRRNSNHDTRKPYRNLKRKNNFTNKNNISNKTQGNEKSPERKKRKFDCMFCKGPHYSDECDKYKTLNERKAQLKNKCYICFRENHNALRCRSKKICVHCKAYGKHHRALCPKKFSSPKEERVNTLHTNDNSFTILQTAVVSATKEDDTKQIQCRILLDSGSQRTYITKRVADQLKLEAEENSKLIIFTFGSKSPHEIDSPVVTLKLKTRLNQTIKINANVVPLIVQSIPYPRQELNQWKNTRILADDGSLEDQIDILIGNDYYYSLMSTEKIQIKKDLFLVNSEFGWILSGRATPQLDDALSVITYVQTGSEYKLTQPDSPIDQGSVTALWELESIGIKDSPKANRDEEAINHFNKTTKIINGRYTVSWPWTEYPPVLSSNYGLAYGRMTNLVNRLDKETLKLYDETLRGQIENGIIELVQDPDKNVEHPIHYLPHHCVSQKGKPIRIVYDASSKIKDNKSLNECLYCGPMMLEDLTSLLIQFRCHRIALSADVEKAFLQVALHDEDRDVTRFLWLKDLTKPITKDNIICLRFCRVPFGIITSPFLLNATIKHHLANSNSKRIKEIANNIYVDNLITGTSSEDEALKLYEEAKTTFQQISMNLREWSSNSEKFITQITDASEEIIVKILGLNWNVKEDTIKLKCKNNLNATTKREVLKVIASIYDPCGYSAPLLLSAKLFLQELWNRKVKWDSTLPEDMKSSWVDIQNDLEKTDEIVLPRFCMENEEIECQLHCFTDASLKAYAAVVYLVNGDKISFMIGKSRLVPMKDQDVLKIPRLELLGVLIGSRLIKYVQNSMSINITHLTLWTDSQIVIEWYRSHKLLPPFVSRRIQEIKRHQDLTIRHVPSEMNPADVATKSSNAAASEVWLRGPQFLTNNQNQWPQSSCREVTTFSAPEVLSKETDNTLNDTSQMELDIDTDKNIKDTDKDIIDIEKDTQCNDEIVQKEQYKDKANEISIIKTLQREHFPLEIEGKETSLKRNLGLFLDVDGILRCRGRMLHTTWSYDEKHPILIPPNSEFTEDIIMKTHSENYHVGTNHTLSIIRQKYWIPKGRSQVQKTLRKCKRCVKHGGGPYIIPQTPDLPHERVNYSAPFTFAGIDYFGPLLVNNGSNNEKRWVCLVTCLAVRAVHMEVVKDLTAEECLLALRRFVATRGIPNLIVSDNATNFKLCSEIFNKPYCKEQRIKWRFIPQLAPWNGGFYERLIAIVKNCLMKTLGKHLLKDSDLATVIKEIEAVVNTRPLTHVGSDPNHILRPADFLAIGKCLIFEDKNIEDKGATAIKLRVIEGWKKGQKILDEYKDMFKNQYLRALRERYNNSCKQPRVKTLKTPSEGDLVQIKGDTKNRENWKIGKISSVLKGSDGQCRVARVDVNGSEYTRSIGHLYPLEVDESDTGITDSEIINGQDTVKINTQDSPKTDCYDKSDKSDENFERNQESIVKNTVELSNDNETESRPKRIAAVKAMEKIRSWTQSLTALLCSGRECREDRDDTKKNTSHRQ